MNVNATDIYITVCYLGIYTFNYTIVNLYYPYLCKAGGLRGGTVCKPSIQ